MKTLKIICSELNISRRAVQGYEKAGLVKATRKNKYGHLLYDQLAQERIERIKFLQDMGFSVKEIGCFIDAPREILKAKLEEQIPILEAKVIKSKNTIKRGKELIKELEK